MNTFDNSNARPCPTPVEVGPSWRLDTTAAPAVANGPCLLRILAVNWRCIANPLAGGAELHLHRLMSLLVEAGHRVTVLCSSWRGAAARQTLDGVEYVRVGCDRLFHMQYRPALRRLLHEQPFNLVLDDVSKIPLGIHRFTGIASMAIVHHIHGPTVYHELPRPLAAYVRWMENRLATLYRQVPILAVSHSTRRELLEMGLAPSMIRYAHNGVDPAAFQAAQTPKSNQPLLVHLGRLSRYKNVPCLLRAFARIRATYPQARLVIAGQGRDEGRLKRLAGELHLSGVEFAGHVSERQKADLLGSAWLYLAASMKEGWGITILEAGAAGVPVIASDVPGHRDSVRHGLTGMLYPYDDDRTLAQTAIDLIGDETHRRRMGQAAIHWARRFTWQAGAAELLSAVREYYPRLLAAPPRRQGRFRHTGNAVGPRRTKVQRTYRATGQRQPLPPIPPRLPHAGPLSQFIRFAAVGLSGLGVGLGAINLAMMAVHSFPAANVVAFLLAGSWNFALNRRFTFAHTNKTLWRQWAQFMASCALGSLLNWAVSMGLYYGLEVFQRHYNLAAVLGVAAGCLANFLTCKRYVFTSGRAAVQPPGRIRQTTH